MIPGFHGLDLIVILVIALLIFGPKKLPEMGSAIGKSIKEFRKGMNELAAGKDKDKDKDKLDDDFKPATPSMMSYEALEREIARRHPTVVPDFPPLEKSQVDSASASGSEENAEEKLS